MLRDINAPITDLTALYYYLDELFQGDDFEYEAMTVIQTANPNFARISILINSIHKEGGYKLAYSRYIKDIMIKAFPEKRLSKLLFEDCHLEDGTVMLLADMRFRTAGITIPLSKQEKICELDGCKNTFTPNAYTSRFCSKQCSGKSMRGVPRGKRKPQRTIIAITDK